MCGDDPRSSPVYHTSRPAVPDWAILGAMNAAYRQLLDSFGRGWEAGDVDGIVSVFAPDAVFLETPFSEQSVGSDAIRAYWKDIPVNQAEVTFKAGEIYAAGPWFATEFRCTYRRRRHPVAARTIEEAPFVPGELTHGAAYPVERGVVQRPVTHRDIDVLEPRRGDRGGAERLGLHRLADVEDHLAPGALQGGEMGQRGLATGHDAGNRLARVGDAGGGLEQ